MSGRHLPTTPKAESCHRRRACAVLALVLLGGLAACKTAADAPTRSAPAAADVGARLSPVGGSATRGFVTFRPYDGGVTLIVNIGGVTAGRYRIAVHATPNCTSQNAFSAGPPVLLPGTSSPVAVNVSAGGSEETVSTVVRIAGLAMNALDGKSVVLHSGISGSLDASPGVPNGRIACGSIGPVTTLF